MSWIVLQAKLFMAYSLLHEYVPRDAEALQEAGPSVTEMQANSSHFSQ
jgi:hypothetical protein